MPSDQHTRGSWKGQFCSQPAKPPCGDCPSSEDYIKVCEPAGWASTTYYQLRRGMQGFEKKYEAHHILCVSPVTKVFLGDGSKIESVIKETKWCINEKVNMIALPLWGHTVKHYCSIGNTIGQPIAAALPPPFANLPQHNFDHSRYTREVNATCERIAAKVEKSSEAHKLKPANLKATLDTYSRRYDAALRSRAMRGGGTHTAWTVLAPAGDPTWCHPFSMASKSEVTHIDYPGKNFNDKLQAWIKKLADAIAGKLAGR